MLTSLFFLFYVFTSLVSVTGSYAEDEPSSVLTSDKRSKDSFGVEYDLGKI